VYGKLGDLYKRKRILQTAVVILLAGSALCGTAQDMTELIAFRAVHGLGGSGLIVLTQALGWFATTPAGEELVNPLVTLRRERLAARLTGSTPEEQEQFAHVLSRLARDLLAEPPQDRRAATLN
jgi:MFS family permease